MSFLCSHKKYIASVIKIMLKGLQTIKEYINELLDTLKNYPYVFYVHDPIFFLYILINNHLLHFSFKMFNHYYIIIYNGDKLSL